MQAIPVAVRKKESFLLRLFLVQKYLKKLNKEEYALFDYYTKIAGLGVGCAQIADYVDVVQGSQNH